MNVHYITFRTSVQATESDDRVKNALSLFLFNNKINETRTLGHFGNPIILLDSRISGRDCSRFVNLVRSNMPEHELERLNQECCERIDDDCSFFIKFDKQAAFRKEIRLAATSDVILARIKLKAYPANYENALECARTLFQ